MNWRIVTLVLAAGFIFAVSASAYAGGVRNDVDMTVTIPYVELNPDASLRILEDAQHPFDDPSYFSVINENYHYLESACPNTPKRVANLIGGQPSDWTPIQEGSKLAFAFNSKHDTALYPRIGRLQVTAEHELVQRYGRAWIGRSATFRCINQYDTRTPLMPAPPYQQPPLPETEVRSWCKGSACSELLVGQLVEGSGDTNPWGALLVCKGTFLPFSIPAGIAWDDEKGHHTGPAQVTLCGASFRRTN